MPIFHPTPNPISDAKNKLDRASFLHLIGSTSFDIAKEDLSDFFSSIKDGFVVTTERLTSPDTDRIYLDTISNRHETLNRLKRIRFQDLAYEITSKPEGFKGYFTDFLDTLIEVTPGALSSAYRTLDKLKTIIGYFITDYQEGGMDFTVLDKPHFKKVKQSNEDIKKQIGKFFPLTNGSTKTEFIKIYRRMVDFELIFSGIEKLKNEIKLSDIEKITRSSNEVSELVDFLLETNMGSGNRIINTEVRRELLDLLSTAAEEMEVVNYIFANVVNFYGVFHNHTLDIEKLTS